MSLTRSFLSRRSSSIRCLSLAKSLREFRPPPSSDLLYNPPDDEKDDVSRWASLIPELLAEIIGRVESSEDKWPLRRNVVACACVCKRWRDVTREIVKSPLVTGRITFPSCLKQVIYLLWFLLILLNAN